MKATRWRRISRIAAVVSVLFLASTLLLPYVKVPETVQRSVPGFTPPTGYQVYGFGIPPVAGGTEVDVTISGYKAFDLQYTLSPVEGNIMLPSLAFGRVGNGSDYSFSATAADSYELELTIIAYNGSGFSVHYSGTWSPFDEFKFYVAPAVFLAAASLVAFYYFGTRVGAQLSEEKVERELEQARQKGSTGKSRTDLAEGNRRAR